MSYRPWRIIWLTTLLTVSTGILKPIPADAPEGLYIAMLQSIMDQHGYISAVERSTWREQSKQKHTCLLYTNQSTTRVKQGTARVLNNGNEKKIESALVCCIK